MARSRSSEHVATDELDRLIDLADEAIVAALAGRTAPSPDLSSLPLALGQHRAVFVSLHVDGELNGCIGAIDADEPVAHAVPRLAERAAFADPRLPPLQPGDYTELHIEVSLLSATTPIVARRRRALTSQLRPGIDGLLLRAGHRQGLFLPVVWQQLPDPDDFVDHLLAKAGIHPRSWPTDLEAERFTTQVRGRPAVTP